MQPDVNRPQTSSLPQQGPPTPQPLDAFAANLIRCKARQLVGKAGFTRSDQEDIEQELTLRLLRRASAFDPGQAHWNVFVTTVVERCAASLLRDRRAEKRDHRRTTSLHQPLEIDDEGQVEVAAVIGQDGHDRRLGRVSRADREHKELEIDLSAVLGRLPQDQRDLAERLKLASVSQVARDLNLPRTTLLRRMERLRRRFEKALLRDYL
jgi:RNA polymerase sigma-70 factor (ECF subfamily)